MSLAPTLCSECGNSLKGKKKGTRTCSDKCRQARSLRLRNAAGRAEEDEVQAAADAEVLAGMRASVRGHLEDRVKTIMDKELAPVVREAITEDVQRSISALLALTPAAVQAIMEDLTQTDSFDRRQKAYTLLMKYTAGHPKLVTDVDPTPPSVTVVFPGMERPEVVPEADVVEGEFECDACNTVQPDDQRAAPGADRCQTCHDQLQEHRAKIVAELNRG